MKFKKGDFVILANKNTSPRTQLGLGAEGIITELNERDTEYDVDFYKFKARGRSQNRIVNQTIHEDSLILNPIADTPLFKALL